MRFNFLSSTSALALAVTTVLYSTAARSADVTQPAEPDWYVSLFGGASIARAHAAIDGDEKIKLDDGFLVGGAIGRDIGNGFRSELEISYSTNENDRSRPGVNTDFESLSGDTSVVFVLGNIWRDIHFTDGIQPYVGAGLGVGILHSDADASNPSNDPNWDLDGVGLAGQLGAGIRFALSERLAMDAGYRLRSVIDVASENGSQDNASISYYSHGVQLGASYSLGENSRIMVESDEPSSWYVSLFAGAVFSETSWNYDDSSYFIDHKSGFTVGAALGSHIAPGLRAELELSYAESKLREYFEFSNVPDDASGISEQIFVLANVWKDFDLGWVTPYIGGGVGVGGLHVKHGQFTTSDISNDTQFGLAGQFGAGARVAVSDNMSVEIGYRFKSLLDVLLEGDQNDNHENTQVSTYNHVIQAGFNWGLGETITPVAEVAPDIDHANYVSLFGGVVVPEDAHANIHRHDYLVKFKSGFTIGAALGGNIAEDLRGEIELSYQKAKVDNTDFGSGIFDGSKGEVESYFLFANLWRDFDIGAIRPYIGAGIGLVLVDVDIVYDPTDHIVDDQNLALAAQAGTGLRFGLTDRLTLDMGYRFKGAMAVFTEGRADDFNNTSTYYAHIGQAGLQWAY